MGLFKWLGGKIASSASGVWNWMTGSTTGQVVAAMTIEYAAYSAWNWWMDNNEELLKSQFVQDVVPYLGMMHTRQEMVAKLRPLLNNNSNVNNYMNDKMRLGHIIGLYSSVTSSTTMGLSTQASEWIDTIVDSMLDDVSTNEEEANLDESQQEDLSARFRVMATRIVRFICSVHCLKEDDPLLELNSLQALLAAAVEICYSSKYFAEWKDGDLAGVSVTNSDPSPINFFSVVSDMYETSNIGMEADVQFLFDSFNNMFGHTSAQKGEQGALNWKHFIASMALKSFKQYVMASQSK